MVAESQSIDWIMTEQPKSPEPDDVRRIAELSNYLAGVEKKMSETQKP